MTQKERAQVWARKDELTKALNQLSSSGEKVNQDIKEQIEQCNQALVQNNYELMPQNAEV